MAYPISRTITTADLTGGFTAPWAYDWMNSPFIANVEVIIPGGSSVASYTLQNTLDDLNAVPPLATFTTSTANWVNDGTLNGLSASSAVFLTAPQRFGRLSITGLSGSILLRIVQGLSAKK